MKAIIILLLLIAIALSAFTYYAASSSGLWGDSKTIRDHSHSRISNSLIPPP